MFFSSNVPRGTLRALSRNSQAILYHQWGGGGRRPDLRDEKDHVPPLAGQVGGILQGVGIDTLEHVQGGRGHVSADARTVD